MTFSVTEVRNALRCPRIFALGRTRGAAVAFPIGSSCLGASFHRLVDRFAKVVASPPPSFAALPSSAHLDDIEAELRAWLLDLLTDELEADATLHSMPGEVDDLAQALRELARHLAARLRRFYPQTPTEALGKLVRESERHIEAILEGDVHVRGTLDALYAEPDGSLEVVEYKLTDEANDTLDRAQAALYGCLLEASSGVRARAVVLRFMPLLRETALSAEESAGLTTRTLLPLLGNMRRWAEDPHSAPGPERRDLCASCPMATPCEEAYPEHLGPRDAPPAGATRPRLGPEGTIRPTASRPSHTATASDEEGQKSALGIRDLIVGELRKQGIVATSPRPPVVGPTLFEIELSRPRGSVKELDRAAEDVKHRLAGQGVADVAYEVRSGRRYYVVKRPVARKVLLSPLLEEAREYLEEHAGRFVLGQRPTGECLTGDLADASTPHLLVGGTTGSGKSVLLRALLASLVHYHGPSAIRFSLIDPKRVTFTTPAFQAAVASYLDGPVGYDAEDAIPTIERLVEVMEERYFRFHEARVSDLREYNEQVPVAERLERRVLVIDEFQDLTADKSSAKPFFDGVKRLGAKARAAGVHLVLATQRPDRDVVPPLLKTNLGGKVALRVATQTNSRIILDEGGAEKLLGKGDLLANLGHGLVRAQAPMIE